MSDSFILMTCHLLLYLVFIVMGLFTPHFMHGFLTLPLPRKFYNMLLYFVFLYSNECVSSWSHSESLVPHLWKFSLVVKVNLKMLRSSNSLLSVILSTGEEGLHPPGTHAPWARMPPPGTHHPGMHEPPTCTPPGIPPPGGYYEMRSMTGRYASYWNAFLF